MKKLMTIFGILLFASVMMISCGESPKNSDKSTSSDTTSTSSDITSTSSDNKTKELSTEISQQEKHAIYFSNLLCEMKEIQDRLQKAESQEEYEKLVKSLGLEELNKKYTEFSKEMDATYPDEFSKESLEIKDRVRVLLLKCCSQEEIDNMFSEVND